MSFAILVPRIVKRFLNVLLIALAPSGLDVQAEESAALRMVQTIPLENVEGRIDHLAVDLKGQRLFIAALGNNTAGIVDIRAGKRTKSISDLQASGKIVGESRQLGRCR